MIFRGPAKNESGSSGFAAKKENTNAPEESISNLEPCPRARRRGEQRLHSAGLDLQLGHDDRLLREVHAGSDQGTGVQKVDSEFRIALSSRRAGLLFGMELNETQGIQSISHNSEGPTGLSGRPHPPAQFLMRPGASFHSRLVTVLRADGVAAARGAEPARLVAGRARRRIMHRGRRAELIAPHQLPRRVVLAAAPRPVEDVEIPAHDARRGAAVREERAARRRD
eukprot:gene15630-biopygen5430